MQPTGEATWLRPLEWALSIIGGAGAAFVFFRTRVGVIETKLEALITAEEKRIESEKAVAIELQSDKRLAELRMNNAVRAAVAPLARRQMATLEILVDIARANGADKRVGDGLLQMLADERRGDRNDE